MAVDDEHNVRERYKDKLTPVAYIKKQLYDVAVSFGSMGVGAVAGHFIGTMVAPINVDKPNGVQEAASYYLGKRANKIHVAGILIGSLVGSFIGQIIQGYDRWSKHEAARMAMAEVNQDVANITVLKQKTDPELVRENETLREMYTEVKEQNNQLLAQQAAGSKVLEEGPRKPGATRESSVSNKERA